MTGNDVKKLLHCGEKKCGIRKPLRDAFYMLHTISETIERYDDAELEAVAMAIDLLRGPFDRLTLGMYAQAGTDYERCRAVMTIVTCAAFLMLKDLTETYTESKFRTNVTCSGLIQ